VLVQSEKSPEFLEGRIEAFLTKFAHLEELDESSFEKHKVNLINKVQEKPKNFVEEALNFCGYILSEMFDFEQGKSSGSLLNAWVMMSGITHMQEGTEK